MKMSFEKFKEELLQRRGDFLPEEMRDAQLTIQPVDKLNGSYEALVIRSADYPVGASINLNRVYEDTKNLEMSDVIRLLKGMAGSLEYDHVMQMMEDNHYMKDYDSVKGNLFLRCSNTGRNASFLESCPHREMNGVVLTVHVGMNWKPGTSPRYSTVVSNDMLEAWNVTGEKLFSDAKDNAQKRLPVTYRRLSDFLMGVPGGDMLPPSSEQPDIFVLTNKESYFGAAAAFYPDVMRRIHERMGNYYMLPSSVHEWLLLPETMGMRSKDLEKMVRDVNHYEVSDEDYLSDDVYHFDGEKMELGRDYEKGIQKESLAEYTLNGSDKEMEKTAGMPLMM